MPQAQDLVLKNGASTPVDKTFSLTSPAAGDGGKALWRLKEGSIAKVFPFIEATARPTGNGGHARRLEVRMNIPSSYTTPATGLTAVGSSALFKFEVVMPLDYPENLKPDFVAFAKNLVANALMQSMMNDATPAT